MNDTPDTEESGTEETAAAEAVAAAAGEPAEPVAEPVNEELDIQSPVASDSPLEKILEALLMASELPLPLDNLHRMLGRELGAGKKDIRDALDRLAQSLDGRAVELKEVASGWRIQVRKDYAEWVSRLWQEKPPKLSRALMETLAIITYRQPVTRGEVEEIRGVALSPNIIRTLSERGWIREVGVKEVPGRPTLFGTTHQLLDDLNVKSLDELPSLPEIKDPEQLEAALTRIEGALPVADEGDEEAATAEAAEAEAVETAAAEDRGDDDTPPGEEPPAEEATLH